MVVQNAQIALSTIDDHDNTFFDILEGLEGLEEVLGEFWKLICSRLADVGLVDHDDDLDLGVDVEQALHEEAVRDLVLFSLVVLEAGTVVEG